MRCCMLLTVPIVSVYAELDLLASKNQTSITIAFVGPYTWINGLEYNGSLITNGYDQINITAMSDLSQWGYASWWFWNQVGAQIGIESINSDPAVLPNTTIRIKRFNNYCSPVKRGSCGGLAMKVAQDISNDHPDVVAVFGDFFGSTTIFSAEVFSKARLPFCGGTQLNKALLNKNNYPYFMQTMASAGRGDAIVKLLQMWKVQRVGILFTKEVRGSRSECASVYNALVASNIDILSIMESVSVTDAEYIGEQFNIVGVRYIIACDAGESLFTMYMALTKTAKKLVGPGYVWISLGTLTQTAIKGNLDKKYGADFFKHAEGFVSIGGGMMSSAKMYSRQEQLLKAIQDIQSPWGSRFGMEHLTGWFNGVAAFDCVGLLGYGLDKLLRKQGDASLKLLLSGELQTQMNHSLFSDTGYQGVSADPLKLTPYGDLATPFFFYYTNGSTPALKTRVFAVTNIELTDIHYVQNAPLFYGGGNLPPPDGPQAPEVSILFGSVLSAGFIILAGFGMAFSAGLLGLVYLNHDHDVIRTGSPLYLTLICLGSILRYSSILLHIGQYSRKVKQYQFVFESISLVVVVAACLIRNLKELFWFGMFSTVVAIEAIMLAFVWQFFGMNRTIPQRGISIIGNKSMVMIIAIHMFHVLLFLGLFVLGCLTRNISSQHNESVLLVTFALAGWLGQFIRTMIIQGDSDSWHSRFSLAVILWTVTTIPILAHFIPKRFAIRVHQKWESFVLRSLKSMKLSPITLRKTSGQPSTDVDANQDANTLSRDMGATNKLGFLAPTCRSRSHSQQSRQVDLPRIPITYSDTFPVAYSYKFHNSVIRSRWEAGVVAVGKVAHNRYIALFPFDDDTIANPLAFTLSEYSQSFKFRRVALGGLQGFRMEIVGCSGVSDLQIDFWNEEYALRFAAALSQDE